MTRTTVLGMHGDGNFFAIEGRQSDIRLPGHAGATCHSWPDSRRRMSAVVLEEPEPQKTCVLGDRSARCSTQSLLAGRSRPPDMARIAFRRNADSYAVGAGNDLVTALRVPLASGTPKGSHHKGPIAIVRDQAERDSVS